MSQSRIAPVHPGEYLRELLDELGLSQYRLAQEIGVAPMRISHVVRRQRPVTAELALRLGRYFGQSPRFWMNLQTRYDIDVTEQNSVSKSFGKFGLSGQSRSHDRNVSERAIQTRVPRRISAATLK